MDKQALQGIRILDFSRHMAGPYASVVLSDYGADVIKVESLPHGDPSRRTGVDFNGSESVLYLLWNRGKRSIALDMRKPEAMEIIQRLVSETDVLLENYRPGVADKIGIGYKAMSVINPRLVYCSVSGFGAEGPLASYPATDPLIQGMTGVMSVTGERGRGPVLVGIPIVDFTGAMLAVQGIMFALYSRERTGRGQKVDVSLLFGIMSALATRLASFWATGKDPERYGSSHSIVLPYQAFQTSDGWAMAGTWGEGDWPKFCAAIERQELAVDPRFASNRGRLDHRDELMPILEAEFPKRTTADWQARFKKAGALFGPIFSFSEIFAHPHVKQSGVVQSIPHPTLGEVPQMGPVIKLSETPGKIQSAPPLLGQHTSEVLRSVGYTEEEITKMADAGIVAQS